jgi:hypothetical protein
VIAFGDNQVPPGIPDDPSSPGDLKESQTMSSRWMTPVAIVALFSAAAPVASAADKHRIDPSLCARYENSIGQVPDWYAAVCLGGRAVHDRSANGDLAGVVPGDVAFYKINFPAPLEVRTAPLPTLTFTSVGPNARFLPAIAFNPAANVLYAVDNDSRQLGTINETTGAFTVVGTINPDPGAAFGVVGLAFDATAGGQGYLALTDGAPSGALLYRINVANAALTPIGPITNTPFAIDLAIDATGQMWSHDTAADTLIRVDKNTGAPTVVGSTGMQANFAQGMMYDHSDNSLYGCAFVTAPVQGGQLVRFNTTTGAATVLAGPVPDQMECSLKRAAGACTAPGFSGIATATSGGTAACAVNLTWNAAVPCGATTVKYNVYRSTTPNTPPSAATLIASCLTTLNFTDTTAVGGTRYYYKVRAEDDTTAGSGPCNGGVTDANTFERSAVPTGPVTNTVDDVEGGGGAWDTSGGTGANPWTIVTTASHSPTRAWFWSDPATVSLQPLTRIANFTFGAGGGRLSWWHRVETEFEFDGYVLEYSLDGGTAWSDILAAQGPVPANQNRFVQNGYNVILDSCCNNPLPGRRAWSGILGLPGFSEVIVDMTDFAGRDVKIRWRAGSDDSQALTGIWLDDITLGSAAACTVVPNQSVAPEALAVDAGGNGVYQPNETVSVAPTWRNTGATIVTLTGALTNHTGPAGPTYTIPDGSAAYGAIAIGASASCATAGNCYSVANSAAARPSVHWDSTALETVTPTSTTKTWTLHIGESFTDVTGGPFFRFVETLLHNGVTGGCTTTTYCPSASTTRAQMAVFVLVSREGPAYVPTACVAGAEAFADVPASSPFCRWIEELADRNVVAGCGGGNYCPSNPVSREQMAVFVLRTLDPTLNPPACAPPNTYGDVPETSPFCRWIEELTARGVVTGCGGGNYCPGDSVTREQMGVFLTQTFGLTLYGL